MCPTIMMGFITHYLQSIRARSFLAFVGVLLLGGAFHSTVYAEAAAPEISQFKLEGNADGVYLSAAVSFELTDQVQDALQKGVPVYFVAQAELVQERWYWTDKKVATVERHLRLAYQALTRKWRLSTSSGSFVVQGLGLALSQSFENLSDALTAIKRVNRWHIADAADLDPNVQYHVNFKFQLDVSQLPRPLQIGVQGQADWSLELSTRQVVTRDATR